MHPASRNILLAQPLARPDLDLDAVYPTLATDGAASFASASSQSLTIASNSSLQATGDAWGACWVNLATGGAVRCITAKYAATGTQRQWSMDYENAANRFRAIVSANGSATTIRTAETLGAPSTGVWYFLMWYLDVANNLLGISGNGGAFDTATHSGGLLSGTAPFSIGAVDYGSGSLSNFWNGQIDSVVFGKSPPGGIAAIATTIRDALYNGGSGLAAKDLTDAQRTAWGVVSGWDFDGPSGNLVKDYIGSNTLTNNNGVTYAAGKVSSRQLADADAIASWFDRYGGTTWSQSTAGSRPLYKTGILNGFPVILGDGTDDFLSGDAAARNLARATAGFTMLAVCKYGKSTATQETTAFFSRNGASNQARAQIHGQANYSAGGRNTDGGSLVAADSALAKGTSSFVIQAGLFDFAGGPVRVRLNGTQSGSSSFATPGNSPDTASDVAELCRNSATEVFQGNIARLLCWRRVLRPDEIRRWERHLGRLYNIAVAG